MYCEKCGSQIADGEKFCGHCGAAVAMDGTVNNGANQNYQNQNQNYQNPNQNWGNPNAAQQTASDDKPSGGWGFLSFLFPIVGIILFAVWRKDYPQRSKSCMIGFIVGLVLQVVSTVISIIVYSLALAELGNPNNWYYSAVQMLNML